MSRAPSPLLAVPNQLVPDGTSRTDRVQRIECLRAGGLLLAWLCACGGRLAGAPERDGSPDLSTEAGTGAPDASADAGTDVEGDPFVYDAGVDTADACASGASCTAESGVAPPSCATGGAGTAQCGSGDAGCCTSLGVLSGTYDRSYDGITYTDDTSPATVSALRLDRYEVTVGRFRQFVGAVLDGWRPPAGSGKHAHLNGGQGLAATGGGYETGWDATNWNSQFATTAADWNSNLAAGTWTATAGSNEDLPITQVTWYEAYAFCIWDGGFLPSESEWNYAATGGSDQRAYPWSAPYPPGSTSIDCTNANYDPCGNAGVVNAVGSESPAGDGKWGQSDLAGNVWEWNLDWYADSYVTPCRDCANLTAASYRVIRGGSFGNSTNSLFASERDFDPSSYRGDLVGARCARTP
jgi:formylglycine-generating enzyme required for sulfatase activity